MIKKLLPTILLVHALLAIFPSRSHAYFTLECDGEKVRWRTIDFNTEAIRLRMSAVGFPEVSGWTDLLTSAVAKWNRQPTQGRFLLTRERNVALDNEQNEVWFTDSEDVLDGSPAIAHISYDWWDCEDIEETDIAFRSNGSFTASRRPGDLLAYRGASWAFEPAALHELGHALGLQHNGSFMNIMGTDGNHLQTQGDLAAGHIGQDAAAGAVYLYGQSPHALPDFSIHHIKFRGAPGAEEYAPHEATRTTSPESFGMNLRIGNERIITVRQGQPLDIEFTPDHNDVGNYRTPIGIYLSADRTITSRDRRVLLRDYPVLRGFFPVPETFRIEIPKTLPAGDYYAGAIIDPENEIEEMFEDNNATFAMYGGNEIVKIRVEAIEPPSALDQAGAGLGGGIHAFYSEEGRLQLEAFPELRAVQEGFASFPNLACQTRFRLYRNGILEGQRTTPPAVPGTRVRWIPANAWGTLASGNYRWTTETLCDSGRIVSAVSELPLIGGKHFEVRVPARFPSVNRGVAPSLPSLLRGVAVPQAGGLPMLSLEGESFDRNGDDLHFRFTIRLVPGSTPSRDAARVRTLEQGLSVFKGPIAHPPLGSSSLATHAWALIPPAQLVEGRYRWELCAKDASQQWQCSPGAEIRATPLQ